MQTEATPSSSERSETRGKDGNPTFGLARRVLVATCVVVSVLFVLLFVWYAADLLLLVFAGVLVSILLRGFSRWLHRATNLGRGWSLALVTLTLVGVLFAIIWLAAGRIGAQANMLREQLPRAVESLSAQLEQYELGQRLIESLPRLREQFLGRGGNVLGRVTGLASTTLGALVNVVVVAVIGLYLAAQPDLYSGGIKRLFPFKYRARAGEVFGVLDEALWRWLLGRMGLMLSNGLLTALGLWLLGVPLALTLGLLAGLLNFIPNFGPFIAAVPAILIALLHGPRQALYVALLYFVLQMIDGYVFTPLVDRKSVELPPVLAITAQVLLGFAFGFIGLLLASPLTATMMLLVKMLYVEDVLGDPIMRESNVGAPDTAMAK
ncbi:MAG: AI-2E family transporter [Pyrinomonadaceae bacterium]|nr:AI-2E family transporter [Pyrinomonadaceae bacterium]